MKKIKNILLIISLICGAISLYLWFMFIHTDTNSLHPLLFNVLQILFGILPSFLERKNEIQA